MAPLLPCTTMLSWWFEPTPLKNHGVSNSWDDELPNPIIWKAMESHNPAMFQSTKQITADPSLGW